MFSQITTASNKANPEIVDLVRSLYFFAMGQKYSREDLARAMLYVGTELSHESSLTQGDILDIIERTSCQQSLMGVISQ